MSTRAHCCLGCVDRRHRRPGRREHVPGRVGGPYKGANVEEQCESVKILRAVIGGTYAAAVFFMLLYATESPRVPLWVDKGVIGIALFGIMAMSSASAHEFHTAQTIGSFNKHGNAYFGLEIFFSALAAVGFTVHAVVGMPGGSGASLTSAVNAVQESIAPPAYTEGAPPKYSEKKIATFFW